MTLLVIVEVTLFCEESQLEMAIGLTLTTMLVMYTMYQVTIMPNFILQKCNLYQYMWVYFLRTIILKLVSLGRYNLAPNDGILEVHRCLAHHVSFGI